MSLELMTYMVKNNQVELEIIEFGRRLFLIKLNIFRHLNVEIA